MEERDGIYYHTWKLNYGEDADIVITKYAPNGVILMSIVISIFVLSLAIIFVIIFITRKNCFGMEYLIKYIENDENAIDNFHVVFMSDKETSENLTGCFLFFK